MRTTLRTRRRRGQGYYEYALILTIVGMGLYLTTNDVGQWVQDFYYDRAGELNELSNMQGFGQPQQP